MKAICCSLNRDFLMENPSPDQGHKNGIFQLPAGPGFRGQVKVFGPCRHAVSARLVFG
jgi:hypothetical protein